MRDPDPKAVQDAQAGPEVQKIGVPGSRGNRNRGEALAAELFFEFPGGIAPPKSES